MFTGLVEEVGTIRQRLPLGDGVEFVIEAARVMDDLSIEDSISVQGVCLTVVERNTNSFRVQAVEQTLSKTTLSELHESSRVNLERAVLASTRLGGHIVQGHVDCVATIDSIVKLSTSHEIYVNFDPRYASLVVNTGSVCLNGISLTVAHCTQSQFMIAIIPHTWNETTIRDLSAGSRVNIEFDILGKYIQRMHEVDSQKA